MLAGAAMIGQGPIASAEPFFIDNFSVAKGTATNFIFNDSFSDGNAPPNTPTFSYNVDGVLNEASDRVRLDRNGALIVPGIDGGGPFFFERARLNTSSGAGLSKLSNNSVFWVTGQFDFAVPIYRREFYGIALTDENNFGPQDDYLHLGVFQHPDGVNVVEFFNLDSTTNTFTSFGSFLLDPNPHTQITFTLAKLSTSSSAISASFSYDADPAITFATTPSIYHSEIFTRAEFLTFSPVPEPVTLLVLGAGLAGLTVMRRRQRRK